MAQAKYVLDVPTDPQNPRLIFNIGEIIEMWWKCRTLDGPNKYIDDPRGVMKPFYARYGLDVPNTAGRARQVLPNWERRINNALGTGNQDAIKACDKHNVPIKSAS